MSAADDAVNAVADQLVKAKGEIDSVIAELEAQAVSPQTVERLKGVSQSLDDIKPDAEPEPTPDPEPEPEPTPEQ